MKISEVIYSLYKLAKVGAIDGVNISTNELGKLLGLSQQSASRRLIDLEALGYIYREIRGGKSYVIITEKGYNLLKKFYLNLRMIFEKDKNVLFRLRGRVFTGFGEGAYYTSLPGYKMQFVQKLGFEPYPGTLNLRLDLESIKMRKELELLDGIIIHGFEHNGRTYGSAKCFKALIENKIKGAILLIERTHYGIDVLEVVAPVNLRKSLKLKDGDWVTVTVLI